MSVLYFSMENEMTVVTLAPNNFKFMPLLCGGKMCCWTWNSLWRIWLEAQWIHFHISTIDLQFWEISSNPILDLLNEYWLSSITYTSCLSNGVNSLALDFSPRSTMLIDTYALQIVLSFGLFCVEVRCKHCKFISVASRIFGLKSQKLIYISLST